MKILQLEASIRGDMSHSRHIAAYLVEQLQQHSGGEVITRDIAHGLPLIDAQMVEAYYTPSEERSPAQKAAIAVSEALVDELEAADVIVAAIPMYNFAPAVGFKAWVDLVARVGRTFRYTEQGPEGLLHGKRFYAVIATGGTPVDSESDFVTPYVRRILAFMGITDVHIIAADQYIPDAEAKLKLAREQVDSVLAQQVA